MATVKIQGAERLLRETQVNPRTGQVWRLTDAEVQPKVGQVKQALQDSKKALQLLQEHGFITKTGQNTKKYGGAKG